MSLVKHPERTSLAHCRVLVVGMGGLGCPAAMALARAGVGVIGVADDDVIEESNLHRQILFDEADVGLSKVEVAARRLVGLAPELVVQPHFTRMLPSNAVDLASRYDVVVEGSDNFATKFLAADAAHLAKRPIVHAAAVRWHGTVLAVGAAGKPCYRCLFEDLLEGPLPNCSEAGVVGPMVGVIAALQADLAVSILRGKNVEGTLVTFDGKTLNSRRRVVANRPGCLLCSPFSEGSCIDRIDAKRYVAAVADEPESCAGDM